MLNYCIKRVSSKNFIVILQDIKQLSSILFSALKMINTASIFNCVLEKSIAQSTTNKPLQRAVAQVNKIWEIF